MLVFIDPYTQQHENPSFSDMTRLRNADVYVLNVRVEYQKHQTFKRVYTVQK